MRPRRFAAARSMWTYNEPEDLRHADAATRVYVCVTRILDDRRWYGSPSRGRQHAAQAAEETAYRQLVEIDPERYVDPVTGTLHVEAIRRYLLRTVGQKARGTWRYDDAETTDDAEHTIADRVAADPFSTLCAGGVDADPVIDAIVRWHADLEDLRDLAAERRRDAAERDLPGQIVRDWVETHPEDFPNPEVGEVLALRAEGHAFKAIAERLAPDGDPAALRRASARARKHAERGRALLPAPIAAYLPAPNRHGQGRP